MASPASRCAGERARGGGGARVSRRLGFLAMALAFVAGVATTHGCLDDRKKVAAEIFFCNPSSRTADADCGTGFMCYAATQAVGGSICVPSCDPNDRDHVQGRRVHAVGRVPHALHRARRPTTRIRCPAPLVCGRATDSPIEAAAGPDGVCLPLNARVRDQRGLHVAGVHRVRVERHRRDAGHRAAHRRATSACRASAGRATSPASRARRASRRLAEDIPAPDVCSPICTPVRDRKPGRDVQRVPARLHLPVGRVPADGRAGVRARLPRLAVRRQARLHRRRLLRLGRRVAEVRRLRHLRAAVQDRRRLRAVRSRRQPAGSCRTTPATTASARTSAASSSR